MAYKFGNVNGLTYFHIFLTFHVRLLQATETSNTERAEMQAQSTLVISTSNISNYRLSQRENLILVLT